MGNRVWIGLLALVPLVGLVMMFVLAIKGNRWAWEKKQWRDIEHFHDRQRKWAIAGLVVLALGIAIGVLVGLAGGGSETTSLG